MTSILRPWQDHQRMLALAFPMILANITTPLLGMVDTAVLGHMDSASMLAGSAIGALILTQTYWVCGFLRMSTTGLSAQVKGQGHDNTQAGASVFYRSALLALLIGGVIWLSGPLLLHAGIYLAGTTPVVEATASEYFSVRVWGAPAAMLNMACIGFLVGQQCTRTVLVIQVLGNVINGVLDVFFVYGLNWGVEGVALASTLAEYTMAILGLVQCYLRVRGATWSAHWFEKQQMLSLISMNSDMLLRNLALQICIAFLTFQGTRLGATQAAVNAVIMQFFVLIALGLDGVAYAVEALVGEAKGAKSLLAIRRQTAIGLIWSSVFAGGYAITFWLFGTNIIFLLTDIPALRAAAQDYLWVIVLLPLIGHWCFLFDGIFVGLTQSKAMRNTMVVSALTAFFPVWWLCQSWGNMALWIAMLSFLFARGLTLGWMFFRQFVKGQEAVVARVD